ncbi:MAG TPA: helix-turn-helix transcriptional regulator [Chitinophagaceae bacterium]
MTERTVHEGYNVKRIREIMGVKQDALAVGLGLTQQAVSLLEQKEALDKDMLEKIAKVLKVTPEAIKNFAPDSAVNIISNTVTNYDNGSLISYRPTFNPIEKLVEALTENKKLADANKGLYERLVQAEREKVSLLETFLKQK